MTAQTVTTNQNADEVGFIFTGVANASTTAMSSPIGNLTWTARTLSISKNWNGLAQGAGYVLALASDGISNISIDGITWTAWSSIGSGTAWSDLAFGNNCFVAVNSSSTTAAYANILTRFALGWQTSTLPSSAAWNHIAFSQSAGTSGRFVTVASSTTACAYSDDNGATWSPVVLPASLNWSNLRFNNGFFVLIANGSRDVYTSTNGETWTLQSNALPAASAWTTLAWIPKNTNGVWVATRSDSTTGAAYSLDNGATWTASVLPSAANWKALCGGKSNWDGRYVFIAAAQSAVTGTFSYDGITWFAFACTSAAWNRLLWTNPIFMSGDTLTINNGATLTVNSNQTKYWSNITITSGKLRIENNSTSTPIRFGMGKIVSTAALNHITPSSGLGSVEVVGNWIELGSSTGGSNQTFASPYTMGDYIPTLWVETGNNTGVYEIWTNISGARDYDTYSYYRNGFKSVGNQNNGNVFAQDSNQTAVQYINLANCTTGTATNIITCTSTSGLVPGTWLTGRDLPAPTIVETIINSTTFTVHTKIATGRSAFPIIGILPICSQYSTTLRFGDGVNGKIPVSGARVKIQNILLTDYTSSILMNAVWSTTNLPCEFIGTNGGKFNFNCCLFGESYSNYTQAVSLILLNVGFSYVPFVSECYQVSLTNVGFGLPPMVQTPAVATALGATGSTNSTTTVTIPSSTAIIPGVLITGTNLHACTVSTVNSATSLTVSTAAFGTAGTIAFSYYGVWSPRDHRMTLSNTLGICAAYSAIQWNYISNATFDNIVIAYGGHMIYGSNSSAGLGGAVAGGFNIQYSNNITVNNLNIFQVGSFPRNRPWQTAITTSVAGTNQSFSNVKLTNIQVLGVSAISGVTCNNITHSPGINNEGYNWVSGTRVFSNPAAGTELANDTKYYFKTRSHRSINFLDSTTYIDGLVTSAVMSNPEKYKFGPRYISAVPSFSLTLSPCLVYGKGLWIAMDGRAAIGAQTVIVSSDNGATWTSAMLPIAATTAGVFWRDIIYASNLGIFFAVGAGGAASTLTAYSKNGLDWIISATAVASAIWQKVAFDNSLANKFVAVSGGNAASIITSYSTDGITWVAGGAIANAQWIDVASSGAGRFVAIAGGSAVGTVTSISTNGSTWAAGGVNVSSLWQSIAYGSSKFVCISASAVNGPTSYSADGVAWTASTAPSLVAGMNWNKIIWTGSVFVILAGPTPLSTAAPAAASASQCYATSADGITWSALNYLPDFTFWISCASNGNAVGFISTQTGSFAHTPDITAATPTWTLSTTAVPIWNKLSWFQQDPSFTTTFANLTSVSVSNNSNIITCASTTALFVGAIIVLPNAVSGSVYLGTGAAATQTNAAIVTGITNSTTFTINTNALRTQGSLTATVFKNVYQLFRSTTSGFTDRSENTLIGSTASAGSTGAFVFEDTQKVLANTSYFYILRKLSSSTTIAGCSGSAASSTITTSNNFYNWKTSTEIEGISGTNILTSRFVSFYAFGLIPDCIVTGTGVPVGTTITEINDFNSITLSANLTLDVNARGSSRTTIGFSPGPGMYVYASNVGLDCKVVSVDSTTSMTVSINNTNTFSNMTLTFVYGFELPEFECIPQYPIIIQNNLIQSTTLATSWTASGVTVTNAAVLGPLDNFVSVNGNAPAGTGCLLLATAANGTVTQAVKTGVGSSYNFSIFARARHPDIRNYITLGLSFGTATNTITLTNQWKRYDVNFVTTSNSTNAVLTVIQLGSQIEVQQAQLVLGNSVSVPTTATTTTIGYLAPQQLFTNAAVAGLAGYCIDGGGGIETNLATAPVGQFFAHCHLGTAKDFTISDQNQVFSTEAPQAVDTLIGVTTVASNISINNLQPVNNFAANCGTLLYATAGVSGVTIKNSKYAVNGTTAYLYNLTTNPAYNIYLHNIDVINLRSYLAVYQDGATVNNSSGITLQNIRSNRTSRCPWAAQSLNTSFKGVFGVNTYPAYNGLNWNLNTSVTIDSFPLTNTTVYDDLFREMTFGNTGKGCIDLKMIQSSAVIKPYTIISGNPFFTNQGTLLFQTVGDQIVFETSSRVKGVTGFSKKLPQIYGTDVGLDLITSMGILVQYDLDKGTGYSDNWKLVNGNASNLSSETGIDPSIGFLLKIRCTARAGLKYTGQSSQFIVGETIGNTTSNPTATFRVVADEVSGATTTGTLIVDTITGEWNTGNTLYSGVTTRATITVTNAQVFFPQPTSSLNTIRIFTEVDLKTSYNYPFAKPYITLTGLELGSEVKVFRTSDSVLIAGIESTISSSWTAQYDYYEDVNVYFMIHSLGFKTIRLENQVLTASGLSIPIQQQIDRNYSNL